MKALPRSPLLSFPLVLLSPFLGIKNHKTLYNKKCGEQDNPLFHSSRKFRHQNQRTTLREPLWTNEQDRKERRGDLMFYFIPS